MSITATTAEKQAPSLHLRVAHTAFDLLHAETTAGLLKRIKRDPQTSGGVDFGAEVHGIDLNNFTDADFAFISDASHRHKLLVFKGQPRMLEPHQQYRLTSRQVHGQGAYKLYLRDGPDAEEHVVDDLGEDRAFMDKIMRPVLAPDNIYAHPHQEQDVILWYNRALWHSITEFPESCGLRVVHQCNIAAPDHPSP